MKSCDGSCSEIRVVPSNGFIRCCLRHKFNRNLTQVFGVLFRFYTSWLEMFQLWSPTGDNEVIASDYFGHYWRCNRPKACFNIEEQHSVFFSHLMELNFTLWADTKSFANRETCTISLCGECAERYKQKDFFRRHGLPLSAWLWLQKNTGVKKKACAYRWNTISEICVCARPYYSRYLSVCQWWV